MDLGGNLGGKELLLCCYVFLLLCPYCKATLPGVLPRDHALDLMHEHTLELPAA